MAGSRSHSRNASHTRHASTGGDEGEGSVLGAVLDVCVLLSAVYRH